MFNPATLSSHFGGIGRALATPRYRIYWTGQAVMVQGFWIYKIASGWLMFDLTHSPAWLGALGSGYLLPILFLGPFGGAVADRFGYRRCAIAMGSSGAAIAFLAAILAWTNLITPILLVLLTLIQGLLFAFEFPARQALYPNLVERKDMPAAIALNSTTFHSSAFTGPAIGGVLIHFGDIGAGFAANAFCMAWMVGAIFFIPSPPNLRDRLAEKKASGIANDLRAGLKYTRNHIDIRLLILLSVIAALLVRPYLDFLPGFAGEIFNRGKEGLAALTSAAGIGALIFASVLAFRGKTKGLTTFLVIGQSGSALFLIAFALTDNFFVGLATLALVGGLLVFATTSAQSLIQHSVDDDYRARVISINVSLVLGAPAISALIIGWLAEFIGLQWAIVWPAIVSLAIFLPVGLLLRRRRRKIEAEKV